MMTVNIRMQYEKASMKEKPSYSNALCEWMQLTRLKTIHGLRLNTIHRLRLKTIHLLNKKKLENAGTIYDQNCKSDEKESLIKSTKT